ncbi:MAG: hypothetical protein LBP38_03870, partial [Desulfovibrio sp.]|nr:hypothetical protein [Desulfovibrio sp.]
NISKLQVFPSCAEVLRNILATCWFYNIFAPKIYPLMYTLKFLPPDRCDHSGAQKLQVFPRCVEMLQSILTTC